MSARHQSKNLARKEGKNAVKWTQLSCYDFKDNQVRLQLFALAFNLGNFLCITV